MTSSEYAQKLKDPRWQKRRLEIFNLHNFTCHDCGSAEHTLHAHHCYYIGERDPWNYPDDCFQVLCEGCHQNRHAIEATVVLQFRQLMARHDSNKLEDIQEIFGRVLQRKSEVSLVESMDNVLAWPAWALGKPDFEI